jgi:hypothetical protein
VQAFYGSKYIGLLKLSWSKAAGLQVEEGSGPVLLGSTNSSNPLAQDPAVAAVIAPLKPAVDALQNQVCDCAPATELAVLATRRRRCRWHLMTQLDA